MKKKKNIVLICQLIPCNLKDPLVLDLPDRSRCFPRACRFTFHLVSDQFSGRGLCYRHWGARGEQKVDLSGESGRARRGSMMAVRVKR